MIKHDTITENGPIQYRKYAINDLPTLSAEQNKHGSYILPTEFYRVKEPQNAFEFEFTPYKKDLIDEIKDVIKNYSQVNKKTKQSIKIEI